MKSSLKWKRAATIYPTDHIISSRARELGTRGFRPQYEEVKHVNMRYIMSNEYMRLWFKERELYQKENYAKQEKAQNDAKIKRGFVQRMTINPKLQTRELPTIQLKRFQDIISKVDTRRTHEEKTKICERYKKTMEPISTLQRYKPFCTKPRVSINTIKNDKEESTQENVGEKQKPQDAQPKSATTKQDSTTKIHKQNNSSTPAQGQLTFKLCEKQ